MSETIIGAVPDEWRLTTLGDLCRSGGGGIQTGPFGSQLHASDYVPAGIPSVMPQNIGDNVILEDGIARINNNDAQRLSRYLLSEGDIVYSRRGDVERRALVRSHQDGWLCGTGCLRVRLAGSAEPKFISYYLGHPEVRSWIVRHAVGATMPNLNTAILSGVPVVVPPANTQRVVGEVLGALEDKIAVNSRILATATELAVAHGQRLLSEAGGAEVSLGDYAEITKGVSYRSADLGAGENFLVTLKCVGRDGSFQQVGLKPYSGEHKGSQALESGDIVVAQTDLTQRAEVIGRPVRVVPLNPTGRLVASLDLVIVRPGPALSREVLIALLDSQDFRDHALSYCNGTTVLHMGARALPDYRFKMPDGVTVAAATEFMSPLLLKGDSAARENRTLVQMRDTLLPGLLSGAIRARDAEKILETAT
ncbi:restriction endonuclease subunit S [Micromonospora sp. MED01]|uniref:restriction endonuclease subunit S n=1 Tax=Micromonospora alfalfae TaxID=2911212 RepID=UPI001EE8B95D|nr:restriction endonuclease subunit S [Micromonospora alfalfae]MCG5463443.1 restriction endonuclease subunit S [Micromonospora alfalfae]